MRWPDGGRGESGLRHRESLVKSRKNERARGSREKGDGASTSKEGRDNGEREREGERRVDQKRI